MKKLIPILLLAALVLGLSACDRSGSGKEAAEPTATPSNDELAILAASDTDAVAAAQTHVPPASGTDLQLAAPEAGGQAAAGQTAASPAGETAPAEGGQVDSTAYTNAQNCVGLTIFDLYAVVGKPIQDPVYTASATQEGAQDGTLVYDGFTVRTLRTDAQELVQEVTPAGG